MDRDFPRGLNNTAGVAPFGIDDLPLQQMPLHPLTTAPEPPPPPEIAAVEDFARAAASALGKDYGDWMRETNFFWLRLEGVLSLSPRLDDDLIVCMRELRSMVQYTPDWHPIETCRRALEIALEMRMHLGATRALDLHAFAVSYTEEDDPESN